MAVRFILGTSGTGKTRHCIDAIAASLLDPKDTCPLILLVPEQATYQAERAILALKGIGGYSRLHVLSFQRLEYMLQGRYSAGTELSRIAQQLIIHRVLRQNSKSLRVFGASAKHPGLASQIAQTIVEFHQCSQSPDDIKNLAGKLGRNQPDSISALKFADIALIYSEYLKHIEGAFINPDMQLSNACKAAADAAFLKGARLWIDGFSGFTSQELAMLRELLKTATQSHIALCLDPARIDLENPSLDALDQLSIFDPTERTWVSLMEIIKKNNLKLDKPLLLLKPLRFASSPQLEHIERNLFKDEPRKIDAGEAVQVVAAASTRAEVEYVARRIVAMVRNCKCRYRDIAVVASDLGGYRHYIQAAFADCNIPFFIDMAKPVNQHPVVEVILSALAVLINGFESSDVFAFLKTDLSSLARDEADLLENYCLAYGIDGQHWKENTAWRYASNDKSGYDDRRIDDFRKKAIAPLIELENKFRRDTKSCVSTALQFRQIIDEFLQSLKVNDKLAQWLENADEHRQFVRQLSQLFDELAQVFGGDVMPLEDFAGLLTRAFEQMSLRLIPPSLDQVLVGSIERSRHPDLKAIFLLGASQKQFPVPVRFDSILTDDDRAKAESAGCQLAQSTAMQLAQRQYLVYISFTRASQLLCVSYPLADDEGSAVPPSPFVSNLQSLFINLKPLLVGYESPNAANCVNEHELTDMLCGRLGADSDNEQAEKQNLASLLTPLMADNGLAHVAKTVLPAVNYANQARLDKDVAEQLFAGQIRSSVTRLGSFASCPYQYFARYTLGLRKRDVYSFEPPDLGEFYHKVLSELFKRLKADLASLEENELRTQLSQTVAAVISENTFYTGFISRSQFNQYIITTATGVLEDFVREMSQMMRAGNFRQIVAEMPFEYRIPLPHKRELLLSGYIDRIDIAGAGSREAVVFDYKSREKDFSWARCYHGLDLQLVSYMRAIDGRKIGGVGPINSVGAFYMPIDVGTLRGDIDKLATKSVKFRRKAKGLFSGEIAGMLDKQGPAGWNPFYNFHISKNDGSYGSYGISGALRPEDFERILAFAKTKAVELAGRIAAGDIAAKPYRLKGDCPCSRCEFMPLCRFDWHINDYNFMESMNKTSVLETIGGADGD